MALAAGARFGPYEIIAPLGSGGMGEVYRARDAKLQRDVALKMLPEPFASDPDRVARFEREARTLASLKHPNIAHIYGFEQSGATRAIAMELVEGPTLDGLIDAARRHGPSGFGVRKALDIAIGIASAIEAAHGLGILHRDLKPANISIGIDGTVKVLDFGLATAMRDARDPASLVPTETALTERGSVMGTPAT
jgi:serine/threonine protein kinase